MESRPECRILQSRSGKSVQSYHHGSGLRISGSECRIADERRKLASALDAQHDRLEKAIQGFWPRYHRVSASEEPQSSRVSATLQERPDSLCGKPVEICAGGRTGSVGICGNETRRDVRLFGLSHSRNHSVSAQSESLRFLLV